jgi:DNA-binding CsgD family transcriptional regulator
MGSGTSLHERQLPLGQYEKVFTVLEACDDARTREEFKELVLDALASTFRFRNLTCFVGGTVKEAFSDRSPALRGSCGVSWPGYRDRWHSVDILSTPESCSRLEQVGFSDLNELASVPPWGQEYIDGHMRAWGYRSSAAMHLEFPLGGHALIGITDTDPDLVSRVDAATLRLLSRHLSSISRRLATAQQDLPVTLSERLQEVAALVCAGRSNKEIAATLYLSLDTVKKYVSRLLALTDCRSRAEFMAKYSGRSAASIG